METVSTQRAALPRSAERATLSREFSSPAPTMVKPLGWRAEETTKLRLSPITLKILIGLADMSVVLIALWAAARLAALTGSNATTEQMAETRKVAFVSLPLWLLAFIRFRLYQARFLGRRSQELRRIISATAAGTVGLALVGYVTQWVPLQRDFAAYTFAVAVPLMMAEREAVRQGFARARRAGRRLRPVLIVGDNTEGRELRRMFDTDPALGYRFVGYVNVSSTRRHARPDEVLGHIDDILDIVKRKSVASVMIAASAIDIGHTNRLVRQLLNAGIHVELSPALPDIAVERLTIRPLGRFPVMYVEPFHQSGWRLAAKRCFDAVAAGAALLVLSLPLAILSLLIRIDSRGPVFYRQTRVGKNGRLFDVTKFRTMVPNAHQLRHELAALNEADGPLFKIKNDPRVTRVGRFLRKTSLDELPQLWNVLRGEMSLVGPRPALPEEATLWAPELRDRLRVQPGITGMWQVSGRSNTSFEEYSRLDLYYVDNWSLLADLTILGKTVPAVLFQRGAS